MTEVFKECSSIWGSKPLKNNIITVKRIDELAKKLKEVLNEISTLSPKEIKYVLDNADINRILN